ncbi:DUF551 domain-containing protein [Klebsiella pneumoniae]
MTNNQLAENSVIQLLNSVKLARDNAERADNRVDHSFYYALTIALEELQERRKAAMDSEPVAEVVSIYGDPEAFGEREIRPLVGIQQMPYGTKLYRHAQPVPVVPDEVTAEDCPAFVKYDVTEVDEAWARGFNSCRAAMLQAKSLTTINPAPTLVSLPKNAKSLTGNSPVIPDGYVMVPKEMTDEIGEAIAMQANCCGGIALDIYDAMLAAAPHDIPALNSLQSVDSVADRWIPVSERMPPSRHEVLVGRWWGEKPRWCCKWATYIPGHPDAQSSGWLIPGASWTPTHWMPLPAAPQEDINALIPLVSRNEQEGK